MHLALRRAENSDEAEYGFIRATAILAVVFVTDEADCSFNEQYAEIFAQDGNKVFWSDPSASVPTSAVCWNAGVECIGDPSSYTSCDPVNKDTNGNSGVADADAVLHPMSRYYGLLDDLEQQKQEYNANPEIIVALIGGVDASGNVVYADLRRDSAGDGRRSPARATLLWPGGGLRRHTVRSGAAANRWVCGQGDAARDCAVRGDHRGRTR
jgi:hypothetical protein